MQDAGGGRRETGGPGAASGGGQAEKERVRARLAGGDRRSIGRADEVAADVLAGAVPFGAVFAAMFDEDSVVRMRAADATEKVSAQRPEMLCVCKAEFLAGLPDFRLPEMRWHAAQMLPRLNLTATERDTLAVPALLGYLQDNSRIVQTFALQALADFAAADATLRPRVAALLDHALLNGPPALKARCRRLLVEFRQREEL